MFVKKNMSKKNVFSSFTLVYTETTPCAGTITLPLLNVKDYFTKVQTLEDASG